MLFMPADVRHSCSDKLSSKRERNQQSWWRDFERNLFLGVFGFTEEPLSQPAAASSAQGTPFGCPFREAWLFRAIPHKDCATDASSNFSSDETKSGVNTWCIHEHFCEIWREICKQMACKVARRSLCGIALIYAAFSKMSVFFALVHFIEKAAVWAGMACHTGLLDIQ